MSACTTRHGLHLPQTDIVRKKGYPAGICQCAELDIPNLDDQLLRQKGSTFVHKGQIFRHIASVHRLIPYMGGMMFKVVSMSRLDSQQGLGRSHKLHSRRYS